MNADRALLCCLVSTQPMWAIGIGEVVASNSSAFSVGSKVTGLLDMQEYALIDVNEKKIRPYEEDVGLEHLSAFSVAGRAGHIGLFEIGQFQKGDVVLVSAAAGATGQAVSSPLKCTLADNLAELTR